MKKALGIVGAILGILVLIFLGGAFALPADVSMERSIVIDAPPAEVFPHINSFQNFNAWSPWAKIDPNTKYEYTGPESGVGATMTWASDDPNVGNGTQEITKVTPNELVESSLAFEGFPEAKAVFVLAPEGDGKTKVTWEYHGDVGNNPIGRWMGLMMDDFLGPDYEKGLSNLKSVVEKT